MNEVEENSPSVPNYHLALDVTSTANSTRSRFSKQRLSLSNLFSKLNNRVRFPVIILGLTLVILVVGIYILSQTNFMKSGNLANVAAVAGAKTVIAEPIAKQDLNREFSFPLNDAKGKEVSRLKFVLENAELRGDIIVKGQKATAVKGRTFLIFNMKISNEYNGAVEINSRDYLRLQVNGRDEWLAPEIHNDPVEVQAISTKYTRLGFPINEADKNLKLQVGEINGEKQLIELNF